MRLTHVRNWNKYVPTTINCCCVVPNINIIEQKKKGKKKKTTLITAKDLYFIHNKSNVYVCKRNRFYSMATNKRTNEPNIVRTLLSCWLAISKKASKVSLHACMCMCLLACLEQNTFISEYIFWENKWNEIKSNL